MRVLVTVLSALLTAVAPPVLASEPPADVAELFTDAVRLMEEGWCNEPERLDRTICVRARELFAQIYARYPEGLGALRNQAFIERALGLTASAAASFAELAERAPSQADPIRQEWAQYAREERERLLLVVPRVTILVEEPSGPAALTIDDQPVRPGEAIPLDPGAHVATLRDPRGTRRLAFELLPGQQLVLRFAEQPQASRLEPAAVPRDEPPPRRAPRWPGGALIAAGTSSTLAGLGVGASALMLERQNCEDDVCSPGTIERARTRARAADVLVSLGVIAIASGTTWLVVVPPRRDEVGGIYLHGRF